MTSHPRIRPTAAEPYPPNLQKVLNHAERLAQVLEGMEAAATSNASVIGRSLELRTVIHCALSDLRAGQSDVERTITSIAGYIDGVHRSVGAGFRMRRMVLECCGPDDAITAPDADTSVATFLSALSVITASKRDDANTTERRPWEEPAEVLERFCAELDGVERQARALVSRIGQGVVTMDDVRAFGREGLLDAARSYREDEGVPFPAWACLRVKAAMIDGVRRWGHLPRRVLRELQTLEAGESGRAESDLAKGDPTRSTRALVALGLFEIPGVEAGVDGDTPETLLAQAQDRQLIERLLASLSTRDRTLVRTYYLEGRTLEEAAGLAGVTKSWASRLMVRCLESMSFELRRLEPHRMMARGPTADS
jgi:RNA polymerase sigma factor for flagellar operon FliA